MFNTKSRGTAITLKQWFYLPTFENSVLSLTNENVWGGEHKLFLAKSFITFELLAGPGFINQIKPLGFQLAFSNNLNQSGVGGVGAEGCV